MTGGGGGGTARRSDLLRLLPLVGARVMTGLLISAAAHAVIPLLVIAMTGVLVGRVVTAPSLGSVAGPLGALAGLFAIQQVLGPIQGVLAYRATSAIDGEMRARAMEAVAAPTGVVLVEDQSVQNLLELASGKPTPFRWATPGGAAVGVVGLGVRLVQAAGAAWLVARFSVFLAGLLVVVTLVSRRRIHRANITQAAAFDDHIPSYRQAGYYSGLATSPEPAKELRVFGLAEWSLARYGDAWGRVTASMSAVRHRTARRLAASYALALPAHAAVFVFVGLAAADGRITLATLAVVVQAARQLIDLGSIGGEEYQIDFGSAALPAVAALKRRSAEAMAEAPLRGRGAEGMPRTEIVFDDVSFVYPGRRDAVLDHLDLTVPAGASLAVVGANGAGKTTLVKLLARFYEPTGGRILVDGVDIRELDPVSWRSRMAVIFQDFVRYELSAADNVGLGALDLLADGVAMAAAADQAGSRALIEALPKGWDTILARGYTGGADLSGGEWQRVALARALLAVRGGASVLALDEPTANLDVRAETELFDRLLDVTAGPGCGKRPLTTLLISHRFSTVRRADRICVLDGGRVAELGTHEELVAAAGTYARMFGLQAARFSG